MKSLVLLMLSAAVLQTQGTAEYDDDSGENSTPTEASNSTVSTAAPKLLQAGSNGTGNFETIEY
uniref:Hypothetical secreted peptide n=1 Tax=Rhipicephalus sanguineus TaxID=34632 RepID=C9W1D4_RHISA